MQGRFPHTPHSNRRTSPQLPRHCEEGKARRGNPHLAGPRGAGRRNSPQGLRIATAYGLAMTEVDGGWSCFAGGWWLLRACTAERPWPFPTIESEKTPLARRFRLSKTPNLAPRIYEGGARRAGGVRIFALQIFGNAHFSQKSGHPLRPGGSGLCPNPPGHLPHLWGRQEVF